MSNKVIFMIAERQWERFAITGIKKFNEIKDENYSSFSMEMNAIINPHKFANKNHTRKSKEISKAMSGECDYFIHVVVDKDQIEDAVIYAIEKEDRSRRDIYSFYLQEHENNENDLKYIKSVIDGWIESNAGLLPIEDVVNGYSIFTYTGNGLMNGVAHVAKLNIVDRFETDIEACNQAETDGVPLIFIDGEGCLNTKENMKVVAENLLKLHDIEEKGCFKPEKNIAYPLCVGRNMDECKKCNVHVDFDIEER